MTFQLVDTEIEITNVVTIAQIVWQNAYKNIISQGQINYMLNKFLSKEAIKENIEEGYTYTLLLEDDVRIGFFAYKFSNDYLFLSKLYILPNFQHHGISKEVVDYLKRFKQPIRLTVNKQNKIAIKAYEKLKFKRIESVVTDIGSGYVMDDYIYELGVDKNV